MNIAIKTEDRKITLGDLGVSDLFEILNSVYIVLRDEDFPNRCGVGFVPVLCLSGGKFKVQFMASHISVTPLKQQGALVLVPKE